MTKAELEEENRNLKLRLKRIASLVSNEYYCKVRDEKLAEGITYDLGCSYAYNYILGSVGFFASPDKDGKYGKVH